jgi:hemerythrin-like domain-containing protein
MVNLIEILREEHRNMARLLAALERQIDVFSENHTPDHDVIRGVAEYFLDYPDRCHHPKEDAIFARLCETHPANVAAIGDLASEHRIVRARAQKFRDTVAALLNETDIARSVVVDAAREFISAERTHMRMEERGFFPLADLLLTSVDWVEIEREMTKGSDPVFGGKVESGFKKLSERLLAWEREGVPAENDHDERNGGADDKPPYHVLFPPS